MMQKNILQNLFEQQQKKNTGQCVSIHFHFFAYPLCVCSGYARRIPRDAFPYS